MSPCVYVDLTFFMRFFLNKIILNYLEMDLLNKDGEREELRLEMRLKKHLVRQKM